MPILARLLLSVLLAIPLPLTAQTDSTPAPAPSSAAINLPLAADLAPLVATETLAKARAGDANAAYEAGAALVQTWLEPNLRAGLPFFITAFERANTNADTLYLAAVSAMMIGRIRTGLSDYRDGLAFSEQAEAIARSLEGGNYNGVIVAAMEDQANALNGLSRYRDAMKILDVLVDYHRNIVPDPAGVAGALWTKGIAHEGLNEFDLATAAYLEAMAYYSNATNDTKLEMASLANNLGWVLHRTGEYKQSEWWFNAALPVFVEKLGSYAENTAKNYVNLGLAVFEQSRPDEAIRWAMKAMPYIANNPTQSLDTQRWNFELLARAFAAIGQPNRAIFFGKMAVNAQQAIRATNSRGKKEDTAELQAEWRRLYQLLADLLITQGRISEAQAVLNMEKEEEVFEYLRRDAAADLTKTRATLTDKELSEDQKLQALAQLPIAVDHELRGLMAKLDAGTATEAEEDQIFILQNALQQVADQFDAEVTAFLAASDDTARATLEPQFDAIGSYQDILAELDRPTAILQIATLPDATHLFLTLPGVTQHQKVDISRADLARLVFQALQSIEDISPDAPEKLTALHKVLFAPIQAALIDSGTEVVMLNLDGFLRYVPFAALHDDQGYLVERFAFSLYSAAVPTQFETPKRKGAKTAGFGVTEGHPGFAPLPGVKRELDTIFGQTGVLMGETELDGAFDENSLKKTLLRKPAILHIASHFNLLPGREDDSFLLLGDGAHLALSKIRKTRALRFQGVDLLTLSACQTARGGDGAEIDGFGATAQLNGAGAVMASLWPVSDAATPRLMHDFYKALMTEGLDKAESLRRAQLAMLRSGASAVASNDRAAKPLDAPDKKPQTGFDHPYFWSAFVLMGNWL